MAKKVSTRLLAAGFSLVELIVAVLFTGILMSGMAKVFQSSLSTFYTSGEILSSARRNRSAIDLLYDDLNTAGMYITDLSAPPNVSSIQPPFQVIPNTMVVGAGPDDPGSPAHPFTADELYFYTEQPLGFEGRLTTPGGNAAALLTNPVPTQTSIADTTYTVDCGDPVYAQQLATKVPPVSLYMVLKDQWKTVFFQAATVSGQNVTIAGPGDPSAGITGTGDPGTVHSLPHIIGSGVMFYKPAQMVRYSIKMKNLDPQNTAGIPCLVRDQGTYSTTAFSPDASQESIITENVSGFKVYLSVDSGRTWAGLNGATGAPEAFTTFAEIRAVIDAKLATNSRQDFQSTLGNEHWFRKIPTLVRLDISTRTATKRLEYSTVPTTAAYRDVVQSFVIVPRHFGLPMN